MSSSPVDVVAEVRRAARDADGQDPLDEAADLRIRSGLDGVGVVLDDQDRGFALIRGPELDLVVHPEHRGLGVGGDLLARALAEPGGAEVSSAWSHGDHPAAVRLGERHAFFPERALWVMRRPCALPLPEPAVPDGVLIRPFEPGDRDAVLEVNAAAFATHPEQGALDAEGFAARAAEEWFDPAGLLLAVDRTSGDLLGFHWTKRHDTGTGEVYVVGVSPRAQGRGLGRVLTLAGLHHLCGAGPSGGPGGSGGVEEVLLYVESDNEPAIAVYSGLGFGHDPRDTHVQYRRG